MILCIIIFVRMIEWMIDIIEITVSLLTIMAIENGGEMECQKISGA
jgi:hypothetical protein